MYQKTSFRPEGEISYIKGNNDVFITGSGRLPLPYSSEGSIPERNDLPEGASPVLIERKVSGVKGIAAVQTVERRRVRPALADKPYIIWMKGKGNGMKHRQDRQNCRKLVLKELKGIYQRILVGILDHYHFILTTTFLLKGLTGSKYLFHLLHSAACICFKNRGNIGNMASAVMDIKGQPDLGRYKEDRKAQVCRLMEFHTHKGTNFVSSAFKISLNCKHQHRHNDHHGIFDKRGFGHGQL